MIINLSANAELGKKYGEETQIYNSLHWLEIIPNEQGMAFSLNARLKTSSCI